MQKESFKESWENSYESRVCQPFRKLNMLAEFMQKMDCQLNENLYFTPNLCLGFADVLLDIKREVFEIAVDADRRVKELLEENHAV